MAEKDTKPCEYCSGGLTLYQETVYTKLYMNTFGKAHTLVAEINTLCPPYAKCGVKNIPIRSAFIINYCPKCGRDLRGDDNVS